MNGVQPLRGERALLVRARAQITTLALRIVPSEAQRLLVLTIAIGAVCGFVAVAFHEAIRLAEESVVGLTEQNTSYVWILWALLLPTLGGLVAGVLLTRFFPDARGSGIPQVKA